MSLVKKGAKVCEKVEIMFLFSFAGRRHDLLRKNMCIDLGKWELITLGTAWHGMAASAWGISFIFETRHSDPYIDRKF